MIRDSLKTNFPRIIPQDFPSFILILALVFNLAIFLFHAYLKRQTS